MYYWSERQQRWFAVSLATVLLGGGALAAAGGNVELSFAAAIAAPFVAAAASGRSLRGTLQAGLGGLFALWVVVGSLMFQAGPGYPIFVGLVATFVLRWEDNLHVVARLLASFLVGTGVWALTGYSWEAHWLLLVAIPPVFAVGLADEVADIFGRRHDLATGLEVFSQISKARKLAWAAWGSFALAAFSHMLGSGSPSLFLLVAVVAGISGAAASFSEPPAEGEVRAATFAFSITPPLIVLGALAALLFLLARSDEPWF